MKPDGSKRVWLNLSTSALSGTPYWSAIEVIVAIVSIRPETVLPSFAMLQEDLARRAVLVEPDREVALVTRDRELVRERLRSSGSLRRRGRTRRVRDAPRRSSVPGIQRLGSLAAVAVHREGLQSELPALAVGLHDVLDRRVLGQVDRLADRARQEGLHRAHHADVAHPVDRARPVLRSEGAVEDRQVLFLQPGAPSIVSCSSM